MIGRVSAEPLPAIESNITFNTSALGIFSVDYLVPLPDGSRYLAGGSFSGGYVLKLGPSGSLAWSASLPGSMVNGLAADAAGDAYLAVTDFSASAARLHKYPAGGGAPATVDLPLTPPEELPGAEGVGVDAARGLVYAAYSVFDGVSQYAVKVAAFDTALALQSVRVHDPGFRDGFIGATAKAGLFVDAAGDVWVVGWQTPPDPPEAQLLVLRYGPGLSGGAARVLTSPSLEEMAAAVDPRGGVVVSGDRDGDFNLQLRRVTAAGFGAPFREEGFDFGPMAVDGSGALHILGSNPVTFAPSMVKLSTANERAWQPPYLDMTFERSATAVAIPATGKLDVAGIEFDSVTFEPFGFVSRYRQETSSATQFALSIATGNAQAGTVTKTARIPLTVKVADTAGAAVAGASVTFSMGAAPAGATGHGLTVTITTTASDGTAATILTFGDRVGTYTVSATCSGCTPPGVNITATAELKLVISLSTDSIRPSGTETAPDQPRTTLLVTAAGVSVPSERVANYPVVLVSTPAAFSGGHEHDGGRPTGHFEVPGSPSVYTTDTGLDGSFLLSYVSTVTGGHELITANSAADPQVPTTTRTVIVEVTGLVLAPVSPTPRKYLLSGGTPRHPVNHFGSTSTVAGSTTAAADYFTQAGASIGINDMSLNYGGLFDAIDDWQPPHRSHRVGTSVDVDRCATGANGSIPVNQLLLDKLMKSKGGTRIVEKQIVPAPCAPTQNIKRIHYEFIE